MVKRKSNEISNEISNNTSLWKSMNVAHKETDIYVSGSAIRNYMLNDPLIDLA